MWGYASKCPRKPHNEELVASFVCEDSGNCREGKVLLRIYNFLGLQLPFLCIRNISDTVIVCLFTKSVSQLVDNHKVGDIESEGKIVVSEEEEEDLLDDALQTIVIPVMTLPGTE